jgi:hypothetical protein
VRVDLDIANMQTKERMKAELQAKMDEVAHFSKLGLVQATGTISSSKGKKSRSQVGAHENLRTVNINDLKVAACAAVIAVLYRSPFGNATGR